MKPLLPAVRHDGVGRRRAGRAPRRLRCRALPEASVARHADRAAGADCTSGGQSGGTLRWTGANGPVRLDRLALGRVQKIKKRPILELIVGETKIWRQSHYDGNHELG